MSCCHLGQTHDAPGATTPRRCSMRQPRVRLKLCGKAHHSTAQRETDCTPRPVCLSAGDIECLRAVLAHGGGADEVSVAGTPLLWAASAEDGEAAKLLLEKGADPNGQDGDGLTALFLAATVGRLPVADRGSATRCSAALCAQLSMYVGERQATWSWCAYCSTQAQTPTPRRMAT